MLSSLPQNFHTYFWDVDPKKIDLKKNDEHVIVRLLELGDLDALAWLKKNYGNSKIIKAFKNSRNFSRRTANFYSYLFNIPRKEIKCFQISSTRTPSWSYRN